jgi:hypothetical protein
MQELFPHFTRKNQINQETEIKFLLYCLGLTRDKNPLAEHDQLSEENWMAIIERAKPHDILPLLYYQLTQFNKDIKIPTSIMSLLKRYYFQYSLENTQTFYDLSKIIKEANSSNIPVIVLKGAALAELIYPKIALRPMCDLDLLVKSEDIRRFQELLLKLGWDCLQSRKIVDNYIPRNNALGYKKYGLFIDLHPKIKELPDLNPWINAVPIEIDSNNTLVLCPDDLILFHCVHLYKHINNDIFAELIKFYDIILILRKYKDNINWDYIIQKSYANQCEHITHCILSFIKTDLGEDVPIDVLDRLKSDKFTIQISELVFNKTILPNIHNIRHIINVFYKIHKFLSSPSRARLNDIIHYTFNLFFPSKERMIIRYSIHPTWIFFIYYPIRVILGIVKVLKVIYERISYSIGNLFHSQNSH